jgi:hypothetical protein
MKKTFLLAAITYLVIAFTGCTKDLPPVFPTLPNGNSEILTPSKTSGIKKGEPVLFTVTNTPAPYIITWTVSPGVTAQLDSTNSDTTEYALFTQSGTYTITATIGNKVLSAIITVNDSSYISPSELSNPEWNNTYDTVSVEVQDNLRVTPSAIGDSLALYAITDNSYSCINNYLDASFHKYNPDDYFLEYFVAIPKNSGCLGGYKRATSIHSIFVPADNTSHFLYLRINAKVYSGTVKRSSDGNSYTFTWAYTSGIILSPLSASK